LAHSVSERQLGAILAHEFGHLVCQRRALAAWACHVRAWWFRAVDNSIERFPRLGALLDRLTLDDVMQAQALSRVEEFEADRVAAEAVGAPLLAQTLLEVAARERFLRCDYWVKVMAQCAELPRPSVRPYRDMGLGMVAGFLPSDQRGGCLGDDCGGEDGLHPTLIERLGALREMPALETLVEDSVAERHLGPILPRLAGALDRAWWSVTRGEWRQVYRRSRTRRLRSAS
jgi:Zn-dependent protease with chaperone function